MRIQSLCSVVFMGGHCSETIQFAKASPQIQKPEYDVQKGGIVVNTIRGRNIRNYHYGLSRAFSESSPDQATNMQRGTVNFILLQYRSKKLQEWEISLISAPTLEFQPRHCNIWVWEPTAHHRQKGSMFQQSRAQFACYWNKQWNSLHWFILCSKFMSLSRIAAELVTYMTTPAMPPKIIAHTRDTMRSPMSPENTAQYMLVSVSFMLRDAMKGRISSRYFKGNVYILSLVTFQSCGEPRNPFKTRINVAAQNFGADLEATP